MEHIPLRVTITQWKRPTTLAYSRVRLFWHASSTQASRLIVTLLVINPLVVDVHFEQEQGILTWSIGPFSRDFQKPSDKM